MAETRNLRNHVVICGWNDHGFRLAKDLLIAAPAIPVLILHPEPIPELDALPRPEEVEFIQADPAETESLSQVNLSAARSVVILADMDRRTDPAHADGRTILTALSIRAISSDVHLIAEIRDEKHLAMARLTELNEVVLVGQYAGVMLSRSLLNPAMAPLFADIFASGEGIALVEKPLPEDLFGLPFSQALRQVLLSQEGVLAGLRRGDELFLPPGEDLQLQAGDQLLLFREVIPGAPTSD